jgi:prolyl 4-hydroxylase
MGSELSAEASARAEDQHTLAMYAAEGADMPQSWPTALDLSLQAAEAGHGLAQAELAAMAGDWALAQAILNGEKIGAETCRTLRAGIDLARWFETPPIQIASSSPRIATINGFVAPAVCDWIVARARPMLAPAKVYDPGTGGYRQESVRDNSECHFLRKNSDLVLLALRARIAKAVELPVGAMDAPAVLHYTPGQRFLPHFDFLDTSHPGHAKQVAESGQRVLTLLLYLNDDYEGGETLFNVLGRRYKGRKGHALFFWNVQPDGTPDRRTAHAGLAPTRGEKWLLAQMIRDRA